MKSLTVLGAYINMPKHCEGIEVLLQEARSFLEEDFCLLWKEKTNVDISHKD